MKLPTKKKQAAAAAVLKAGSCESKCSHFAKYGFRTISECSANCTKLPKKKTLKRKIIRVDEANNELPLVNVSGSVDNESADALSRPSSSQETAEAKTTKIKTSSSSS